MSNAVLIPFFPSAPVPLSAFCGCLDDMRPGCSSSRSPMDSPHSHAHAYTLSLALSPFPASSSCVRVCGWGQPRTRAYHRSTNQRDVERGKGGGRGRSTCIPSRTPRRKQRHTQRKARRYSCGTRKEREVRWCGVMRHPPSLSLALSAACAHAHVHRPNKLSYSATTRPYPPQDTHLSPTPAQLPLNAAIR